MNAPLPKAYKDGFQNFYGRDFDVSSTVLIPRPETEFIIDMVLILAGKSFLPGVKPTPRLLPKSPKIIDVGTGSGCIATTLKLELPEAEIIGVDIEPSALKIAEKNAKKFNAEVNFIQSDLLENIDSSPDVIVANLPYVDETWDWLDKAALSAEPSVALYANDGGLELIKRLVDQAAAKKVPFLILEADPCQHTTIINYAAKNYKLIDSRGFITCFQLN